MTSTTPSNTLITAWEEQQVWSLAADGLKYSIRIWRSIALGFGILGAVLETLAAQLSVSMPKLAYACGIAGAVLLVLIPIIRATMLGKEGIRDWVRSRSVSEGLKSEVFLYLTKTEPYTERERDVELSKHGDAIKKAAEDLQRFTTKHRKILEASGKGLEDLPPDPLNIDSYIVMRVDQQIGEYYRPQAQWMAKWVSRLRGAEFIFSLIAAGLGAAATFSDNRMIAAWVAVATTIGLAVTAHLAATRFEHLINTYLSTAARLLTLRNNWKDGLMIDGVKTQEDFVRRCEETISSENQSWMVKLTQMGKQDSLGSTEAG